MPGRSGHAGAGRACRGGAEWTRRDGAGTPGRSGHAGAERARRGGVGTPGRSGHAAAERARRSRTGMPGRSRHAGAGRPRRSTYFPPCSSAAPLPPPSGPTQRPTQPRIRLFPGQLRSSASFRSHALAHPALPPCSRLPRVVFGLPAPCSLPFLRPRPSCLRRAPGPTAASSPLPDTRTAAYPPLLSTPRPHPRHPAPASASYRSPPLFPRPAPTAASSALPLPFSPAARAPDMPPSPSPPGTPRRSSSHVHARCAHAREFSHTLFARLKK